jgi:hypothetical protein
MRKSLIVTVILASAGLIGSAYAQPNTNGPSGTGPESTTGQQGSTVNNGPGTNSGQMTKHKKSHKNMMDDNNNK